METNRDFLKSNRWDEWRQAETDQRKGLPQPPPQKPPPEDALLIDLVAPENMAVGTMPLLSAIWRRRSHRRYTDESLTLEELSFLVWATQGVSDRRPDAHPLVLRTVPSGGARHPFETYLLVRHVQGVEPGLYRYLPATHQVCCLSRSAELTDRIHAGTYDQYVRSSAVVFVWTVLPYRTEWRYTFLAPKIIAQDSGHLCQNLYLACEAIGAGACAIGAYDQVRMDAALGVDGEEEFTVYVATVGKVE
jgi:SagB-type dehydrogenase family enzyme